MKFILYFGHTPFFASHLVSIQAIIMNTSQFVLNYFVTPVLYVIRYLLKVETKQGKVAYNYTGYFFTVRVPIWISSDLEIHGTKVVLNFIFMSWYYSAQFQQLTLSLKTPYIIWISLSPSLCLFGIPANPDTRYSLCSTRKIYEQIVNIFIPQKCIYLISC